MWKLAFIKMMQGKIDKGTYQLIERDRDWYIGAAQTRGNMPNPDMMESLKNNFLRMIKKINQHGDGWASAGHQEERRIHNALPQGDDILSDNKEAPTFFNFKDLGEDAKEDEDHWEDNQTDN